MWHLLNPALNFRTVHGHRSKCSLCHGPVFPLIKFTLPVSSTPSCDEWLIWLWGALFPQVKLARVCVGLTKLFELWQCVGRRETHPPPCYRTAFYSLSPSFSRDHICFCVISFFPPSPYSGCPFSPTKSLWVSRNLRQQGGGGELAPHRRPFIAELSDKTIPFSFLEYPSFLFSCI